LEVKRRSKQSFSSINGEVNVIPFASDNRPGVNCVYLMS